MKATVKIACAQGLALVFLCSPSLWPFCIHPTGSWKTPVIEVVLNETIDDALCQPGFCPSLDAIRWTTRIVLDDFFDRAGADIRLVYGGEVDVPAEPHSYVDGKIHVFGLPCNSNANGAAYWDDSDGDGHTDRAWIQICTGPGKNWDSYPSSEDRILSFQSVLAHELMHALNYKHTFSCMPPQNIASVFSKRAHHLYKDDIDALQVQYGLRYDKSPHALETSDQLDWSPGQAPAGGVSSALSRLAACNSLLGSSTYVAFTNDSLRLLRVTKYDGSDWSAVGDSWLPLTGFTHYEPGVACKSSSALRVYFLGDYDPILGDQTPKYFESDDGGDSWSGPTEVSASPIRTRSPGFGATFDPSTGQYVVAWRDTNDVIVTQAGDGNPISYSLTGQACSGSSCLRASDSVGLACGDPATLGPFNCMMAWAGTGWYRGFRYAHARVANGVLELAQIQAGGYITAGSPNLAVAGSGDFPWQVTIHQAGYTAYTWRKSTAPTGLWSNEVGRSFPDAIVTPTLGSYAKADDVFAPVAAAELPGQAQLLFGRPRLVWLLTSSSRPLPR